MFEHKLQDYRAVREQGVNKSTALFLANSACAEAITNGALTEEQRRVLIGLARAGSAYEAATHSPHSEAYKARLEEALAECILVLSA